MNNGIWKKICLSAVVGLFLFLSASQSFAQDSFREFDRKMVVTPAELFERLSSMHPSKQREEVARKRMKEIEKAGREFLSKLTPEQQDKAWDFAERYLRKNGVDATSSRKLMREFGLPPELQSELSKQLRKFGNRRSDPDAAQSGDPDDPISQLLRKAREDFDADMRNPGDNSGEGANRSDPAGKANDGAILPRSLKKSPKNPDRVTERPDGAPNRSDGESKASDSAKSKSEAARKQPGVEPGSLIDPANPNSRNNRIDAAPKQPARSGANPDSDAGPMKLPRTSQRGKKVDSEAELQQLLKQFGELKEGSKEQSQAGDPGQKKAAPGSDEVWEKLIKNLAEKELRGDGAERLKDLFAESGAERIFDSIQKRQAQGGSSQSSSSAEFDPNMLDRAKDLIAGALKSKSGDGGSARPSRGGSASNEKTGTKFDRLIVKAVERTLESKGRQGESSGVGGMFGNLIDRIQNRDSEKKNDQAQDAGRRTPQRTPGNDPGNPSNVTNPENYSSPGSAAQTGSAASPPAIPNAPGSNSNPGNLADLIPDLSGIQPNQVFAFFAIVGLVLFVGYLLTQALTGNEVSSRRRAVIKQVRNTTIESPKDLVETVDMFLLAKFGIKSSWWNAKLAQHVLNSGSPDLQTRVDELFGDYVRARYMHSDVQIPDADQQRYKKTLEELSLIDIKPESSLGFVPAPIATETVASLEG